MSRNQIVASLLLAFAIGCFAAPLANEFVVRPAQAAPEGVKKWEQYCSTQLVWGSAGDLLEKTNADLRNRGLEGWEIASASIMRSGTPVELFYCFRRPVP